MEEDIQILEEFINNYKEVQEKYKEDEIQAEIERSCYFEEVPAQAIENLINRNKELEIITNGIKVLETNGVNDDTFYVIAKTDFLKGSYKHLLDDYIPKSKVKGKIEELKKEYKIALEENSIKAFILKCQIEILEKLLEEKQND